MTLIYLHGGTCVSELAVFMQFTMNGKYPTLFSSLSLLLLTGRFVTIRLLIFVKCNLKLHLQHFDHVSIVYSIDKMCSVNVQINECKNL